MHETLGTRQTAVPVHWPDTQRYPGRCQVLANHDFKDDTS